MDNSVDWEVCRLPLHRAARDGNVHEIHTLITQGTNVNEREEENGRTALHWARNAEIARILLENGADVSAQDNHGRTPLFDAVAGEKEEKLELIRLLLDHGADINAVNRWRRTPLHLAVWKDGSPGVIKLLLDRGANINAVNEWDETPLFYAAVRREELPKAEKLELIRLLLDHGADINAVNKRGWTPLHIAVLTDGSPGVIKLLLDRGANINAVDAYGETPLFYAAVRREELPKAEKLELIRLLLDHGADINAVNKQGQTLLHFVVMTDGSPGVIKLLLDHGANINAVDRNGETPLFYAVRREELPPKAEKLDLIRLLLDHGADINAVNRWRRTLLHFAVLTDGSPGVIKLLLDHGANTNAVDEWDETPLFYAVRREELPKAEKLELIGLLLDHGADINAVNRWRQTLLHIAVLTDGSPGVIKLLLDHGANINAVDEWDETPLFYAVRREELPKAEKLELIRLLLDHGADINTVNKQGQTLLHIDAFFGKELAKEDKVELIRLLLDRSANIDVEMLVDAPALKDAEDRNFVLGSAFLAALRCNNKKFAMALTVHSKSSEEWTAGMEASYDDNIEAFESLFQSLPSNERRELNLSTFVEELPFTCKVYWRFMENYTNEDISKLLSTLDINKAEGRMKRTPLHWAAICRDRKFVGVLYELKQCDLSLKDIYNKYPFEYNQRTFGSAFLVALKKNKKELAMALLTCYNKSSEEWTAGMEAAYDDDIDIEPFDWVLKYRPENERRTMLLEELPFACKVYWRFMTGYTNEDIKPLLSILDINKAGGKIKRTPLHWAVISRDSKFLEVLCGLHCDVSTKDSYNKSAFQYLVESGDHRLQGIMLRSREDLRIQLEAEYRERQVSIDAVNAILVGAALIAGLSFAGFIQPPLGYPDESKPYVAIHRAWIKMFWIFNSLSFYFAMASVLMSAKGVHPRRGIYIGEVVRSIHVTLVWASSCLTFSVVFVVLAFGAAGFTLLPQKMKYERGLIVTSCIGGFVCLVVLCWFLKSFISLLLSLHLFSSIKATLGRIFAKRPTTQDDVDRVMNMV